MNGNDDRPPPASGPAHARGRPRVLWGRVAFYGLSLVLAFALGLWSAGDDPSGPELDDAYAEIDRLAQENMHLRAENEALEAGEALETREGAQADAEAERDGTEPDPGGGGEATDAGGAGPTGGDAGDPEPAQDQVTEAPPPDARTYVVQQGDTGLSIAEDVYGDGDLWPLIAAANNLDEENLQVDQELVIPPAE